MDVEQETTHYCGWSVALTNGQGIPDHAQGTKTIQEVLNDLKKYATRMIHLPDIYTFHKWFVSALRDSLHNEVLKKGYNTEFSTIDQLYETACMIEEASCYNHGM